MPRKSDEVEALAKVLREADEEWGWAVAIAWINLPEKTKNAYRVLARAAIAHLSKPKRGAKHG